MKSICSLWSIGRHCGRAWNVVKSLAAANTVAVLHVRLHSNDERCSDVASTSKDEHASTLTQVIASADRSAHSVPLTRTELAEKLSEQSIHFEEVIHGNFLRVDCAFCDSKRSCFISGLDNFATCVICHESEPFDVFLSARITKMPRTLKNGLLQEERPQKDDIPQLLEDLTKIDPDLYDRVSYLDLAKQIKEIQQRLSVDSMSSLPFPFTNRDVRPTYVDPEIQRLWKESLDINDMSIMEQNDMIKLRTKLGLERISSETLSRYSIRGHIDELNRAAIYYPKYRGTVTSTQVPDGLKIIRKVGEEMEKKIYPLQCKTAQQNFYGIFGYHLMTSSERSVVLTTNERDAMAVHEAAEGALAFALPRAEKVDLKVLPYLADFEVVYLWFPAFQQDYAKEWGYNLDASRCRLINCNERPIELLRSGKSKDVRRILATEAAQLRGKGFVSLKDIREDVKADLIYSSIRQHGLAQWKRLAPLNKYLQGLRPRELTVLTGRTGFGKTTFLCEYSLDLFTQGVRTLFCSFEMPEEKILKWMLVQFAGVPLYRSEYSGAVDMWLDKFERIKGPLTIMKSNEFREKSINQIAGAIRNYVISSGCQHVIIDNLQFLVNQSTMSEQSTNWDRYFMQDRFVGYMRALASQHGVHVTMVVHPRKIDSDVDIEVQHFGGSARVTQEADNILALQRRQDDHDRRKFRKFLYILKNRYGGHKVETDQLEMVFHSDTYTHTIIDHSLKV